MHKEKNAGIRCTVAQCRYNLPKENGCSLGVINVGTHEPNPTHSECVDCNSFVCDSKGDQW